MTTNPNDVREFAKILTSCKRWSFNDTLELKCITCKVDQIPNNKHANDKVRKSEYLTQFLPVVERIEGYTCTARDKINWLQGRYVVDEDKIRFA